MYTVTRPCRLPMVYFDSAPWLAASETTGPHQLEDEMPPLPIRYTQLITRTRCYGFSVSLSVGHSRTLCQKLKPLNFFSLRGSDEAIDDSYIANTRLTFRCHSYL